MNNRRIVIKNGVPRIFEYFGNIEADSGLGIGGLDYIGYIILDSKSDNPYYLCNFEKIYLTSMEKDILNQLYSDKPQRIERSFLWNEECIVSEPYGFELMMTSATC